MCLIHALGRAETGCMPMFDFSHAHIPPVVCKVADANHHAGLYEHAEHALTAMTYLVPLDSVQQTPLLYEG